MMVYAPHGTNREHLEEVKNQMVTLGAPQIRVFYTGEAYIAIEGSHRIAAAYELGITPDFIEVEETDEISDHDMQDLDDTCTVADILEYLGYSQYTYKF